MQAGFFRLLLRNALLAAIYFGAGWLCLRFAVVGEFVSALWAPSGIGLAAVILFGPKFAPGIALGAFLASASARAPLEFAAASALGNAVAAVAGRAMLARTGFKPTLERVQDVMFLVLFGAFGVHLISATIGTLALHRWVGVPDAELLDTGVRWWMGDSVGALLVAPVVLTWHQVSTFRWRAGRIVEAGVLVVLLVLSAQVVFGGWAPSSLPVEFGLFPLLVWAALRFGVWGAGTAAWITAVVATWGTVHRVGAFGTQEIGHNLAWLYSYVGFSAVTTLTLAASVSARRRAEEAWRETQARLNSAFDNIPFDFWVMDRAGRCVMQNRACAKNWGDCTGKRIDEMGLAPEIWKECEVMTARALTGEIIHREVEYPMQGELRQYYSILAPVRDREVIRGVLGLSMDITDRKRSELALREKEELYRVLTEQGSDMITRHSAEGLYTYVSPVVRKMLGYEPQELLGRDPYEMFHPDDIERIRANHENVLAGSDTYAVTYRLRRKDGSYVWVETRARSLFDPQTRAPLEIICSTNDVSERIRLEGELRQSQKLEAIGRLAGGVAHDFNNLLTIINGYSDLVLNQLESEDPSRPLAEEVRRAGDRAAALTRQLLAFSRKQVLRPVTIDLNALVGDVERMLRRVIREDIELATKLAPDLLPVRADPGQIEQVLLNLAVNARDAMPEGGRLTIETGNLRSARSGGDGQPPDCVELRVGDTGEGMDEVTRSRAFEPFFTTKELGKGTGLGLAMAYGIVHQSGGSIDIQSRPGQGTTFVITLPAVKEAVAPRELATTEIETPGGMETILLVEDEDSVRNLTSRMLKRSGYHVLEARRGADALELCQNGARPIDLLVTDVIMPGMNGPELVDRLVRAQPELRVLYISGYSDVPLPGLRDGDKRRMLLLKPFTAGDLAGSVRKILDAGR